MCGGGTVAKTALPSGVTTTTTTTKSMSRQDVFQESDPDTNCLIIIGTNVYNVTTWMDHHPGGRLTIRGLSGKDATDAFVVNHSSAVQQSLLKRPVYATLDDASQQEIDKTTRDFRELTKQMFEAGYFETEYTFYYGLFLRIGSIFALMLAGVLCSDSVYVHALSGALLGFFWQQIAFVGHDIGHNSVTHDRITDSRLGLVFGSLLSGLSVAWWKRNHNVHHVVTNSIDHDPDIQHMPFFAVHEKFLSSKSPVFSTFYKDYQPVNKLAHALVGIQHYAYFPIMAFARFYLYVNSIMHALGIGPYDLKEQVYRRDLQILSLAGFWTWLLCLTFSLPTWTSRILFFVLAHNVGGMLHVQITLSHFGMPSYSGDPYLEHGEGEFLKTQMKGTLDIVCPTWMDWFHGGLQFQTVHHLWPRMPRRNLRKAQALLISFCDQHEGIEYKRVSFSEAVRLTIATLKETSRCTKSFYQLIMEAVSLSG